MPRHANNMKHFEGNKVKDQEPKSAREGAKREVVADKAQMGPMMAKAPMPATKKAKGC